MVEYAATALLLLWMLVEMGKMVNTRLNVIGIALVFIAGLAAALNGGWFIVGQHPFDDGGYSEEVDLTREEAREVTPELEDWLLHVSDQTGSVTLGWGLFVMALAIFGLRNGQPYARPTLLIGGLPTLIFSAFGEYVQFGTLDTGTIISMGVLGLFLVGIALTYVGPDPDEETENGAVS